MKKKSVIIRGGALGDFLLTLPFVKELFHLFNEIFLFTRKAYFNVIPDNMKLYIECMDIDMLSRSDFKRLKAKEIFHNAKVFVFTDPSSELMALLAQYGSELCILDGKPVTPPHITVRFFIDAGMSVPEKLLNTPLWPVRSENCDYLWLHPGSGSKKKNFSPEFFARRVLEFKRECKNVIVSFGEADCDLIPEIERVFRYFNITYQSLICPDLRTLKKELYDKAKLYLGNDSGVTHLAALLGIKTMVYFKTTDPYIWRPIGNCRIYLGESCLQIA